MTPDTLVRLPDLTDLRRLALMPMTRPAPRPTQPTGPRRGPQPGASPLARGCRWRPKAARA